MVKQKSPTKAQLIQRLSERIARAKPSVQRLALQGLQYQKKSEIMRRLRTAKVSRNGLEVSFRPTINRKREPIPIRGAKMASRFRKRLGATK